MPKTLITAMASGWYHGFAPLFEYTARKFNPGSDVRVYSREKEFPNHKDSATGLLRFCLPAKEFEGYDYVYFTDVDFIFLPHKISVIDYHIDIINRTGLPYAGHRGPIRKRWFGKNTRIAGGAFMATQGWIKKTEPYRLRCVNKCIGGIEYREKDEVYLQRMTSFAGFKIPEQRGCFVNGEKYNKTYRNLHLGDFKPGFSRRWTNISKMKSRYFLGKNVSKYIILLKDERFRQLISEAIKSPNMATVFDNLNKHLERRVECLG